SFPLKSLLLFYPVTKVWNDGSTSWMEYGDGFGLDGSIMEAFNEAYLAGRDSAHPLISPYCASDAALAQLPPVLMINADHDILRDQGEEMCVRLTGAGTDVTHMVLPGTTHLFITVEGQPAAFSAAVKASAAFLSGGNAER
ncbi:MAG: alpha/beta hydrolase, partial [Muribaculaceae bacterium]|nr:alpha/beta hydrolase [Muribaculaceae bacterium]